MGLPKIAKLKIKLVYKRATVGKLRRRAQELELTIQMENEELAIGAFKGKRNSNLETIFKMSGMKPS